MATAAVTARLPFRVDRASSRLVTGVSFDELGGPVVAVCGLTGGAGTTTLALALARHAAATCEAPVLVAEAEPGSGMAVQAGRSTPHSLCALAERAEAGDAPADAFAELQPGLRLIATTERSAAGPDAPITALVEQARDAHGLVVIDCGTSWSATDPLVRAATHRLWVFPATPLGVSRARHAMPPGGQVAVAVARDPNARTSVRTIRRILGSRCERLLLVPYSAAVAGGRDDEDLIGNAVARLAAAVRGRR